MTDNEIIKALECCGNIVDSTCKGCVYHETYNASCVVRLMRDALDLINRQQAEIERCERLCNSLDDQMADAKIDTLKHFLGRLKFELGIAFDEPIFDTIIGNIIESTIDKLLKELTEPTKIEHNSLCETETYESR